MLNCLDTWIGMRDCDDSTSDSGVYINDLPGVESIRLASLVNEDSTSVEDIWTKIRTNGQRRFYTDVVEQFAKRFRIKIVSKSIDTGRVVDTTSTTALGPNYQGIIYELNDEVSRYTLSNLKMISVQTVKIYLSAAVNTTLKVFDLDTMEELYSYDLTGVMGWNTVKVNTQFDAYRVFICYDASTVTAVKLDVSDYNCYGCEGRLRGGNATTADPYTITAGNNAFGLSVVLSENCSYNKLICNNKINFTGAYLYALGIAFVDEVMGNTSLNRTTTTDRGVMNELKLDFLLKYNGGTTGNDNVSIPVSGELVKAVEGINLMENDTCLECNSTISSTYATV